jgi:hypothetical protein
MNTFNSYDNDRNGLTSSDVKRQIIVHSTFGEKIADGLFNLALLAVAIGLAMFIISKL